MKVKCTGCGMMTHIDETKYEPGTEIYIPCPRCRAPIQVLIPGQKEQPSEDASSDKDDAVSTRKRKSERPAKKKNTDVEEQSEESVNSSTVANNAPDSSAKDDNITNSNKSTGKASGARSTSSKSNAKRKKRQKPANKEVIPQVVTPPNKGNRGCSCLLVLTIIAVITVGVIWLFRSCGSSDESHKQDSRYSDSSVVDTVAVEETVVDRPAYDSVETIEEAVDTVVGEDEATRVYLPPVSGYTSSEAYDVYQAYVSDERFGDSWATVDVVQNAIKNDKVKCFVKGEGDIEGYPLSIDAVCLKDGRIYGRYHNDYNGVKLDLNGVFDSNGDLIMKLGHKSETSFWVLENVGRNDDGSIQYRGTWGRNDKPTSLSIKERFQ